MQAGGALSLSTADVAFFTPPPKRRDRPDRRTTGGRGKTRAFIRAFRRELARAIDDSEQGLPRVTRRYPY
jgi:hypothetical protein